MRTLLKRSALTLAALLLIAQLVRVDRTNPGSKTEIPAPEAVGTILERSCYDCHSNRTQWPWYSRVAPASWVVARHVREGRENLNLTEWPLLDDEAQLFFLGEMRKEIVGGKMPLDSYLLLHWDARLSDSDRISLLDWIDEEIGLLSELDGIY